MGDSVTDPKYCIDHNHSRVLVPTSTDSGIWEERDDSSQTAHKSKPIFTKEVTNNLISDPLIKYTQSDRQKMNDQLSNQNGEPTQPTPNPATRIGEASNGDTLARKTWNQEPPQIANYMCLLPMLSNHFIDQSTLGHIALSEALAIYNPLTIFGNANIPPNALHPWKYEGIEKDVYLFSMAPFHNRYSVAGMSIFKHSPSFIYDILRNPSSRFLYDRLLSKFQLIEKIDEHTQVVQMRMALQKCFLKEEREVLAVCSHRELSPHHFVCSGKSTEHPSYREDKRVPRFIVHLSAFIIEPFTLGPHSEVTEWSSLPPPTACKVTYIVKVELTELPAAIIKYVMKRQPLALAYLKEKISWQKSK